MFWIIKSLFDGDARFRQGNE